MDSLRWKVAKVIYLYVYIYHMGRFSHIDSGTDKL